MRRAIKIFAIGVLACTLAATTGFADTFSNYFNASQCTYIADDGGSSMTYTNNYQGTNVISRYTRAYKTDTNRACLVNFDLSKIPADAVIHQADLYVKCAYIPPATEGLAKDPDASGDIQLDVAGVLLQWDQAQVTGGDHLTGSAWNEILARASDGTYTYDGAFDRGPVEDSLVIPNPAGVVQYGPLDVTASMASQIANNKRYGWILHGDMASAGTPDGFINMGLDEDPIQDFGIGWQAPLLFVVYEAFPFDMEVEGSDDPNWTVNNLAGMRTATLNSNTASNKYRVVLGSE